jgi:hypothetical protein
MIRNQQVVGSSPTAGSTYFASSGPSFCSSAVMAASGSPQRQDAVCLAQLALA